MGEIFLQGALLQASLIFALGAQNLFVLESGLQKRYPIIVSLTCFLCDLVIILMGVAGAATLFALFPEIKVLIGILGVIFLFHYGVDKIFFGPEIPAATSFQKKSLRLTVIQAISFSVINPHAYLDGIVLIGGFSSKFPELSDRILFGLGAACFSGVWFLFLSTTSGLVKPFLDNPKRMKRVMSLAGLTLVYLSGRLGLDVYEWMKELRPALPKMHFLSSSIEIFQASGIF